MKIAVLFDGAGLARLGLEQAGHECHGFELDPWKHHLGLSVGSGRSTLGDAREVDLSGFDAVWASPPCQEHSVARTQGAVRKKDYGGGDLLAWTVERLATFPGPTWIENVVAGGVREAMPEAQVWNAGQFTKTPIQNRNRLIGGKHRQPLLEHAYRRVFPGACPCITATEQIGCATDRRRASRYYGRRLTTHECAYHQGFQIPVAWSEPPPGWIGSSVGWRNQWYEAIGNGVPVYMAFAFGAVYR